mmetsp:Transcript_3576/g.4835  ORF Transcript_3576/g.4835 Transcript_3576/m.4835 type:complete len:146 (+) Transcript_3576:176-613(+)
MRGKTARITGAQVRRQRQRKADQLSQTYLVPSSLLEPNHSFARVQAHKKTSEKCFAVATVQEGRHRRACKNPRSLLSISLGCSLNRSNQTFGILEQNCVGDDTGDGAHLTSGGAKFSKGKVHRLPARCTLPRDLTGPEQLRHFSL